MVSKHKIFGHGVVARRIKGIDSAVKPNFKKKLFLIYSLTILLAGRQIIPTLYQVHDTVFVVGVIKV